MTACFIGMTGVSVFCGENAHRCSCQRTVKDSQGLYCEVQVD